MPITRRGRLKRLATAIHNFAPDLDARVDPLPESPGMNLPREAVAVTLHVGSEMIPGVRTLFWPDGKKWSCASLLFKPISMEGVGFSEFDEHVYTDAEAPRWAFGALMSTAAHVGSNVLELVGAASVEDVNPLSLRAQVGVLRLLHTRMKLIYES